MKKKSINKVAEDKKNIIELYQEGEEWSQNLGEKTIHAKRMSGRFRLIKWFAMLIWLPFFILPYIEWNGQQAILFDVNNRMYNIFDITIFPQDIWLLSMVLLFLAILLAFMTAILGRVFCGYFCFQTVWTDIFTKVEELFEGNPTQRRKLAKSKFNFNKLWRKLVKHIIWLIIAILSGVTWMLYFGVEWLDYFYGVATKTTWAITITISIGAYIFAGFMREQSCLWICPYARIQGAMVDKQTILPTYDYNRGEKRGKLIKGEHNSKLGDCIDCNQCVAVCPTGVDIRKGQEYGCITCGLCIDACNSVMKKINKPLGLIRYTSYDEMNNNISHKPFYKRTRVLLYSGVLIFALAMILYGITHLKPLDMKIIHGRSPLFTELSDGSIRNKYELKIMNKSKNNKIINININSQINDLVIIGDTQGLLIEPGSVESIIIYLSAFRENITNDKITFIADDGKNKVEYKSRFFK